MKTVMKNVKAGVIGAITFGTLAFFAGCGGCSSPGDRTAAVVPSGGIPRMEFREEGAGERILGKSYASATGGYAIRPPAGWSRTRIGAGNPSLAGEAGFTDTATGNTMEIGAIRGAKTPVSDADLQKLRASLEQAVRKSGKATLVGSDLYLFGKLKVVQTASRAAGRMVLHFVLFSSRGRALNLAFTVAEKGYRKTARAIEACVASLKFPAP